MDAQEQKYREMTETPVPQLILKLAVPCIISMLVTAFYNMADTFFIGMLRSNSATGAVGIVFSVMAVIQAISFFFGHGSGNYISRCLGHRDLESAEHMAATGFFAAVLCGIVLCVLGSINIQALTRLLGATETILPYAAAYLQIILYGAPFMMGALVLNNHLRFEGSAFYGMLGITSGAILNIILDPILILGAGLGIAGAAWATIIGQGVSLIILLAGTMRGGNIRIRISAVRFNAHYFSNIVKGGLPSLARQGLASFATICLNRAAGIYGDAAIAAMSVVQRIMMFSGSAMIGFGQGFQPVCGFCYGAGLYRRVREGFRFCVKSSTAFLLAVGAVAVILAPQLIALFRDDPEVIRIGALALRLQCCTLFLSGWVVMSNMMLQTIGRTVPATFLAMARQGLFFIPAVMILPALLGLFGVQISQAVADVFTFIFAVPIQLRVLREFEHDRDAAPEL